jgi:flavin-dependent dehydrogenase
VSRDAMSGRHDVAIAGGGLAGAAMAWMLARLGLSVVVIEGAPQITRKFGEVLAPTALAALQSLDLLEALDNDLAIAIPCAAVQRTWELTVPMRRDFLREAGGRAWVVDRHALEILLRERAIAAGVHWCGASRVQHIAREGAAWLLQGTSQNGAHEIRARVAVDATGRAGAIARRLGADVVAAGRLVAVGCRKRVAKRAGRSSFLHVAAVREGWCYAVLGPGGLQASVLVTVPGALPRGAQRRRAFLVSALSEASGFPTEAIEAAGDGELFLADASARTLTRGAGDDWIAIGDAAASFDPITSQGMPNALGSAVAGAHAVHDHLASATGALAAYGAAVARTWTHTASGMKSIYDAVDRWPSSPFWSRMREAP